MKKVYFACSIRAGRVDQPIYSELVKAISRHAKVLSELFGSDKLMASSHQAQTTDEIYQKDVGMIKASDVVIAEVTNPSLGVGYEIALAEQLGKPILCLFRPMPGKSLSAMIDGSPKTIVAPYETTEEAEKAISDFLDNTWLAVVAGSLDGASGLAVSQFFDIALHDGVKRQAKLVREDRDIPNDVA